MNTGRKLLLVIGAAAWFVSLGQPTLADDKKEDKDEKEKIVTTKSGLKYLDQKEGLGDQAKTTDFVGVHYTGTLASNGKQFDSSRGKDAFSFKLGSGQVIKGWEEGIVGMKPGGKRKLWIPAKLAYGEKGYGDLIPANSDLVFEVELLKIRPEK